MASWRRHVWRQVGDRALIRFCLRRALLSGVLLLVMLLGPWSVVEAMAQSGLAGDPPARNDLSDRHSEKILSDAIRDGLSAGRELLGTLFEALEALPDGRLDREGMTRVLAAAGLPPDGDAAALLGTFEVIEKRGDRIIFEADERVTTVNGLDGEPRARIKFGTQGSMRVRRRGRKVAVDGVSGVDVGGVDGNLYPVDRLKMAPHESGGTSAEIVVKVLFFDKKVKFIIPPPSPDPETAQAPRTPVTSDVDRLPSRGIVDALEGKD